MHITLSPVRTDEVLEIFKAGDVLTINELVFDFSQLPEGATLPREAIDSPWFLGPVERIDGVLHLTLRLPHGFDPSESVAFPQPLVDVPDGQVRLPQ